MGKNLKLVLRDPVKLHEDNSKAQELPSPYDRNVNEKQKTSKTKETKKKLDQQKVRKAKSRSAKKSSQNRLKNKETIEDIRNDMSMRVKEIWEYFCEIASEDGNLKNSFSVTRAEVMKNAGIGSTNTYRNALNKFKDFGLLEIELRPGVIGGSIFHLTKFGIEQIEQFHNFEEQ